MESLTGNLLIAANIYDSNFRQTVVLLAHHDADGALGVVINHPSTVSIEQAVPDLSQIASGDAPVYVGGPVQPDAVLIVADLTDPRVAEHHIFGTVGLLAGEVGIEQVTAIKRARVFAGYAGWGPGQLELEMSLDSWIVEPARPGDVFATAPEDLWAEVLRRKGGRYALLATMPYDPTSN